MIKSDIMCINKLRDLAHSAAREKGFWDVDRNIGEMLMLVVSELGEAIEAHRKGRHADLDRYFSGSAASVAEGVSPYESQEYHFKSCVKDTFEDEIADAVIRLLDLCGGLGIDLDTHIAEKIRFNATRDRLHGKKY